MLEIAEMLVVNGLTSELRSWALSNLKPSAEVTPILLPLLGADDRMLRTTVAALLQSFEVDNVSAVKDDPSALYLLAKKSTAAMLAAAKDGSVSAVQQLSAQDRGSRRGSRRHSRRGPRGLDRTRGRLGSMECCRASCSPLKVSFTGPESLRPVRFSGNRAAASRQHSRAIHFSQ